MKSILKVFGTMILMLGFTSITVSAEETHQHSYSDWVITRPAKCKEQGEKERECTECHEKQTAKTPPLGHKWKSTTTNPTYFEEGEVHMECIKCHETTESRLDKLVLKEPTNLRCAKRGTTTLKVIFNEAPDATGYEYYVNGKLTGTVSKPELNLSKLSAGVKQKIEMRALKEEDDKTVYGAKTKPYYTYTIASTPKVTVKGGAESMQISWSQVQGATSYNVYYKTHGKGKWKLKKTFSNKTTSYKMPCWGNVVYEMTVRANQNYTRTQRYQSGYETGKRAKTKYAYKVYEVTKTTPVYTFDKKKTNQNIHYGNYYAGYYDYRYGKNWRVIYFNNSKKLVQVSKIKTRKNAYILPSSSNSQYSGKFHGVGACAVSSMVSWVNAEKGTNWNKDTLAPWVCKKKWYTLAPLNDGRTHGMESWHVRDTIKTYSKGKYSVKNVWNKNTQKVMKEQLRKGKRCYIALDYSNGGWLSHAVVVTGYEYINGRIYFYYTDSNYTGYNLPLRRMSGSAMQSMQLSSREKPKYILVLN